MLSWNFRVGISKWQQILDWNQILICVHCKVGWQGLHNSGKKWIVSVVIPGLFSVLKDKL